MFVVRAGLAGVLCMLRAVLCILRAASCMLCAASCMLRVIGRSSRLVRYLKIAKVIRRHAQVNINQRCNSLFFSFKYSKRHTQLSSVLLTLLILSTFHPT